MSANKKNVQFDNNMVTEIGEDFDKFETWVIQYRKAIITVCVLIVVGITGTVFGIQLHKASVAKGAKLLAGATTIESLQSALKQYPSGVYASSARGRLAALYAAKKDYKQATAAYNAVADDEDTVIYLRGRAALDAAMMIEMNGDSKGAIAAFEKVAGNMAYPEDFRLEAFYSAGRLYAAAGNAAKAKAAFKRAAVKNVTSNASFFWSAQAQMALVRLPQDKPAVSVKKAPATAKKASVKK